MEVMKPITEEEILNSRFCKVNETLTRVSVARPTLEEAKVMDYRTLCVLVGAFGLRLRTLAGSTENANCWLNKGGKDELLELFKDEFSDVDENGEG